MTNFRAGDWVTVNGRRAKVFTILTDDILKVRYESERHTDIISVSDIDREEPTICDVCGVDTALWENLHHSCAGQARPVFDSDADMEDYYRVW